MTNAGPRRRPVRRATVLTGMTAMTAAMAIAACSSDGGGDTGFDLPTAATIGGPVLASPRVQPIYFKGFPYPTDIDTFVARLSASTYWPTVVAEYGVGALVAAPGYATSVPVPDPLTEKNLPGLLAAVLTEGAATLGAPRGDTVYALFFDPLTRLVVNEQTFCGSGDPSAYHDEIPLGTMSVAVAIIPTCQALANSPSLKGADVLTLTLSHELVEAVTDPLVNSNPAYTGIDPDHILWAIALNGAEVADLCENELPASLVPPDVGYPVQRIWSNAGAKAGTGPCVPVPPGEIFFQAVAELSDRAPYVSTSNRTISVPVMKGGIGLSASARVSFRGGLGAPTALAAAAFEIDDATSLSLEKPVGVEGNLGHTVTAQIAVSSSTASGVLPLLVGATDSGRRVLHLWVGGINRK
jgi:hypothetical protein